MWRNGLKISRSQNKRAEDERVKHCYVGWKRSIVLAAAYVFSVFFGGAGDRARGFKSYV